MSIINLELPKQRTLYLANQVDQVSVNKLIKSIIEINDHDEYLKKLYALYDINYKPKPIKIYIDSYGGLVYQCLGLISIIENSKTPVYTYVTGVAMSCGFFILIHGHCRFAYKHSTIMYHQVSEEFMGKVAEGQEVLKEMLRLQKKLEDMTIKKTKITKSKLKEIYHAKTDWYITAEEALKLGVIDKII